MRFEHLIEINSARLAVQTAVPPFTREQLWRGLLARVQTPERFPNGPERCECQEIEPGLFQRRQHFGQHVFDDEVQSSPMNSVAFTPKPHDETTPIGLRITIEEPQAGQMVLRFVYEALGPQSDEEAYYNEYRQSAWLHHDRDMVRTFREWLTGEGL